MFLSLVCVICGIINLSDGCIFTGLLLLWIGFLEDFK
jgi:hypothetical protein